MEEREKMKRMFNLIIQYYINYKYSRNLNELYYSEFEKNSKIDLARMNYHIPEMEMSKKSFKNVLSVGSFLALVEFIITKNVPYITLISAIILYGIYIYCNKVQYARDTEHVYKLRERTQKNMNDLKEIVYEIGELSRELNYEVTLHTGVEITNEYIQYLKCYLQSELDRIYPLCDEAKIVRG